MAAPIVLQGTGVSIFADAVTVLGVLVDPSTDKHRHYSLSVTVPNVAVHQGIMKHTHDGAPDADKPIEWNAGLFAFQRKTESPIDGSVQTEFCVANHTASIWPNAASFEVRRIAL